MSLVLHVFNTDSHQVSSIIPEFIRQLLSYFSLVQSDGSTIRVVSIIEKTKHKGSKCQENR